MASRTRDSKSPHQDEKIHIAPNNSKEPVNLRKAFPIAFRSIFRRSVHWIAAFLLIVLVISVLDSFRPGTESMAEDVFYLGCLTVFLSALFFLFTKFVYELIYYRIYYYGIELEHFVISQGVLFKTRASFPIARMADVYVERTPLDLVFLLYDLKITTHSPIAEHGSVTGLSFRGATDLQNYLLAMVNTTTKPVDEKQVVDTLNELKATEDPSILAVSPAVSDPPRAAPPKDLERTKVNPLPENDPNKLMSTELGDTEATPEQTEKREFGTKRARNSEPETEEKRSPDPVAVSTLAPHADVHPPRATKLPLVSDERAGKEKVKAQSNGNDKTSLEARSSREEELRVLSEELEKTQHDLRAAKEELEHSELVVEHARAVISRTENS